MKKYFLAAFFFYSTSLLAAPFCVVTMHATNCYYYDMNSCNAAANSQSGACIINQKEVKQPSGNGAPFCVVTMHATNCYYYDAPSCQQAASSIGGACIVNSSR